jgi:cation diffusion facilitator family transporter
MHAEHLHTWTPSHSFLGERHDKHAGRTRLVVYLTVIMMVVEIVAGYIFGSMALTADGWHMATHAAALGATAFGYRYARIHAGNARFSFSTGKVGDLVGYTSALGLAGIALLMAWFSIERLFAPTAIAFDDAIVVAIVGLAVNLVSARLLHHDEDHGHGHEAGHDHHDGHEHHAGHAHIHADHNIRSAYLHVLADALTSILAIAALVAGKLLGWVWLDPVMGIVGGAVIARWSWGLLRDTGRVLLDMEPIPGIAKQVCAAVEADDETKVADIHVWRVGPGHPAVILSVVTHHPRPPEHYKALIARLVASEHVTVEVNLCPDEAPVSA